LHITDLIKKIISFIILFKRVISLTTGKIASAMGKLCMKEDPFADLKGNNSGKTYNFRIKAGNVQMVFYHVLVTLEARI
jgi:hypothetical protein